MRFLASYNKINNSMNITPIFVEITKKGFTGKKHTDITKDKISQSKCGVPNASARKLSPDQIKELIEKKANGVSVTQLALEYNVSRTTIYKYL
jgi:DNA invertase Pin-like site-specific DNA recombinase